MSNYFIAPVDTSHFRLYDRPAPGWRVSIRVANIHGGQDLLYSYPQAKAVVDDFGSLVIVSRWL